MNTLTHRHSRFLISLFSAVVIFFLLPAPWSMVGRLLLSWNCGVVLFLVLVYTWITRMSAEQICSRFIEEDETAPVILVICILAAILSLLAIIALLSTLKHATDLQRTIHIALAALTVISSWVLVPTMFALHYADKFYSVAADDRPLQFPQTDMPVFWDFAYFSFTIAAACQTADVSTTRLSVRKVVIAHSLISFFFNASILGFAINVTAGLIGSN